MTIGTIHAKTIRIRKPNKQPYMKRSCNTMEASETNAKAYPWGQNVHNSPHTQKYIAENLYPQLNQEIWSMDFTEEKIQGKKIFTCGIISFNRKILVGYDKLINVRHNWPQTLLEKQSKNMAHYIWSCHRTKSAAVCHCYIGIGKSQISYVENLCDYFWLIYVLI